jgi:hypothetical protein
MKEVYEFRVREKHAGRLFEPNEGRKIGWTKLFGDEFVTTRQIKLSVDDPKFRQVGELNSLIKQEGNDYFFAGWDIHRSYSSSEFLQAELFLLCHFSTIEPAGEECGTKYDESLACPICRSGAKQVSPFFYDWKRIPKNKDIVKTIAGEILVSKRTVGFFQSYSITGAKFGPIFNSLTARDESENWFQLLVDSCDVKIAAATKMGINPFDEDVAGTYRCSHGDLIGLARLSEVSVSRSSCGRSDIIASQQFFGVRRGLLRPERFLLVSPKFQQMIKNEKLTGCEIEVAYLK